MHRSITSVNCEKKKKKKGEKTRKEYTCSCLNWNLLARIQCW